MKSEKGSRASIVQEANADLLRELERYSAQLKDTLKENIELKTLYLQVTLRTAALAEGSAAIVQKYLYHIFRFPFIQDLS